MIITRAEFLGIDHMSEGERLELLLETLGENAKLRALVEGVEWCATDDADARFCPLYDEDEPYRCKKERLMQELGIKEMS